MTVKETIESESPLALFRRVFGKHEGQSLSDFVKECGALRDDAPFVADCRQYALANCVG